MSMSAPTTCPRKCLIKCDSPSTGFHVRMAKVKMVKVFFREWRKIYLRAQNGEILFSINLWITVLKNVKKEKRQKSKL